MLPSYPKIYNVGHPAVAGLSSLDAVFQEKVDGSQFSFGIMDGEFQMRSKGQQVFEGQNKLFNAAAETATLLYRDGRLHPGWIYRGEVLSSPKHNILAYDRVPEGNVIIFDIETEPHRFLEPYMLIDEVKEQLGLECVPFFNYNWSAEEMLDQTSVLGGQKVEGFVMKWYGRFGADGKTLMAKHVSERFKEIKGPEWRANNPGRADILDSLIQKYRTPARWDKAVIHLREQGEIEDDPRDIGKLFEAVSRDVLEEESESIKEKLFKHFWPKISRGITAGMPQWYKEQLLRQQFTELAADLVERGERFSAATGGHPGDAP